MTIHLKAQSTVMFTGDSITDCHRLDTDEPLGYGYPLRIAGEWGLSHPDRPVRWLNTGISGNKVMDLVPRWQGDVLNTRPDVLSVLVGINDVGWHSYDPNGWVIQPEQFHHDYAGLLAPLRESGTQLILIEPFLLPTNDEQHGQRAELDPMIEEVRNLAREFDAELLAADGMFAQLSAKTGPLYWTLDGVHPNAAGHQALARAWLELVD